MTIVSSGTLNLAQLNSVWVWSFTHAHLPDTDNIVPIENTTPINRNKKGKIKEHRAY